MLFFKQPGFEAVSSPEWLLSNGIGGYAASSICGANTRRYHGLLVAAFNPPADRRVLVSKVEETLIQGGTRIPVSSNQYPGAVHPQGFQLLRTFSRKPLPRAVFSHGATALAKTVFMVHGANTVVVEYENTGTQPFSIELNPLFVYRDYHSLFRESAHFDYYHEHSAPGAVRMYPHLGAPALHMAYSKGEFVSGPLWFRNVMYRWELARGMEHQEDMRSIGLICASLAPGERMFLTFSSTDDLRQAAPEAWKAAELHRLEALQPAGAETFLRDLAVSGDQFLVRRSSSGNYTLLAGYPWFTDWGRDTMIAMRGLVIAAGKKDVAESILRTFLQYLSKGMIPNRFPDQGEIPEYNTIDATLWLFVVLWEYLEAFGDRMFVWEVFPYLTEILNNHLAGTRYGIRTTPEGLLYGGEGSSQLTWMDARIGDYAVTPRHGCPVEVNALWYNALCIYTHFGELHGLDMSDMQLRCKQTAAAFQQYFVNGKGWLNDVAVPGGQPDESIRPNQIYAVSLPFSPLQQQQAEAVLHVVERHLYTPYGLRSLAPEDPAFEPVYQGGIWERDTAYHQGTVWAFLWGEYALAYLRVHRFSAAATKHILELSQGLRRHFYESDCLHGISEIFDGGQPGPGKGCIHQAWSAGMLMQVLTAIRNPVHDVVFA